MQGSEFFAPIVVDDKDGDRPCVLSVAYLVYRGTSLIKYCQPPRTTIGLGGEGIGEDEKGAASLGGTESTAFVVPACPPTPSPAFMASTTSTGRHQPPLDAIKRERILDLLVRLHFVIEIILVDRPCAMGVSNSLMPSIQSSSGG